MYKAKHTRPDYVDFDLIVIGTGAGGGVAAHVATRAGKRVAVIENEKIGGECPNYGCVPTKALLHATETYKTSKNGESYGVKNKGVSLDYPAVKAWKDKAVLHTGTHEGEDFFKNEGVKVLRGDAWFLSPWTVSVNGRRYSARKFLIATGTKSVVPPIPGLEDIGYMTYRDAIDLTRLPKSIFVLGGGAIGSEFTEIFSSFGSTVHVADMAPRLIALEDPEVGELLQKIFESRGVHVHAGAKVTRVTKNGVKKIVHVEKNGQTHKISVDQILLATGKDPNTDLGLDNAYVEYDRGGITVNPMMQTTNKHIYAAGDVAGPYRFTHMASYQSRIAAHNMFHQDKYKADYHAVPRCVFTDPEIAAVGVTERELKEKKKEFQTAITPVSIIGRANTSDVDEGFVKVIADKKGVLIGASIVSPRAGEMIHELTLAVQHRMKARAIAQTIHAFPTWSEAVRVACQKIQSS
jgi:dihydrolipoamide dehydrogenase